MQISIDTGKDSHEDIRKAIALLQSIVSGSEPRSNAGNIFDNPLPGESRAAPVASAPSLFSMFDGPSMMTAAQAAAPVEPAEQVPEKHDIELY